MYSKLAAKTSTRVPPKYFDKELEESIKKSLEEEFIGEIGEHGLLLSLIGIKDIGKGKIVPNDGAIYYETEFEILSYKPFVKEIVEGKVSEVAEFGVFMRIGPIDGLVHISQVMDDYVSLSKEGQLLGKETNKTLKKGDYCRARVIAVSLKSVKKTKIGLTLRQPGLGKLEWVEREKEEEGEEDE